MFLTFFIYDFLTIIIYIIGLFISIAFFTLAERKLMGAIQRRKGPDVVGFWGLLQPLADGLKLVTKELIFPLKAINPLFLIGPAYSLLMALLNWVLIPFFFSSLLIYTTFDIFLSFCLSGLNVYGVLFAGWASNSKFCFLASIRAIAQLIAYELLFGMINIIIGLFSGGFTYIQIIYAQEKIWFIFPLFPLALIYLIIMLAETNRTPFDLVEAEAELVAGFNLEYSGINFALFFLAEYANMILLSCTFVIYFLGGWLSWGGMAGELIYCVKILLVCIFFVWVRTALPRFRYDQLMELGWKNFLPLTFGFFFFL